MTLLLAVLVTNMWAQTDVATEDALNAAIADGAHIRLTANITLSEYLKIGQNEAQTVTIDLNGHTLKRNLAVVDANGHVIEVFSQGTLTIVDQANGGTISGGRANNGGGICNYGTLNFEGGTITDCLADQQGGGIKNNSGATVNISGGTILGNWGEDCGGIFNAEGGTLTMSSGTITGNTSNAGGGGVVNYGTATITGGTIHNNHATTRGGGIWNGGTMTMSGGTVIANRADIEGGGLWHGGSLTMEGTVKITNNENGYIRDDLFLVQGKVVNVSGAFTDDASIGISMESPGVFTSGYRTHNSTTNHFFSESTCDVAVNADGEACLSLNKRKYYECSWDEANKRVVSMVKEIPSISVDNICSAKYANGGDLWGDYYWFIADGTATINGYLTCQGKDVHLILCDGASLNLKGLFISQNTTLHIYCQSYGERMGKLSSNSYGGNTDVDEDKPGIGYLNRNESSHGSCIIHGGSIYAKGNYRSAGIGGPYKGSGIPLTIYGGVIEAYGGTGDSYGEEYANRGGAAIGGGFQGNGGTLTVYSGEVYAHGGKEAAGIGAGDCFSVNEQSVEDLHGGIVNIHGGIVKAWGTESSAGIGGGKHSNGAAITISGGAVYAEGGDYAAGIGGGDNNDRGTTTISGGYVYAKGGSKAAGIGGGRKGDARIIPCGAITITGGKVEAFGGENGAGIGGGQDYGGGQIIISGGEVYAHGGEDAAGIGSGVEKTLTSANINGGTITISGGYVYAEGQGAGAGIGAGEDADMGIITITGGIVEAYGGGGEDWANAINTNDNEENANLLTIGPNMKVTAGSKSSPTLQPSTMIDFTNISTKDLAPSVNRFARIEPCDHPGEAAYTITDAIHHQLNSCQYCLMSGSSEAHAFTDDSKCACGLLGLKDDADNTSALGRWNNTTQTVALSGRTLYKDGSWNTLCLPFSLSAEQVAASPLAEVTVKTLASASYDKNTRTLTLTFSEPQNEIVAGKPYIVKWGNADANVASPLFRNVNINNANTPIETEAATFVGTYSPVSIGEEGDKTKFYLTSDKTLSHPNAAMDINAFRAWIQLPGVADSSLGNVNGDREINVADVTELVGYILGHGSNNFILSNADVTGDDEINVTDVTALVDIILHGNNDIQSVVVNIGDDTITYNSDGSSTESR